jgi:hypothetical protein
LTRKQVILDAVKESGKPVELWRIHAEHLIWMEDMMSDAMAQDVGGVTIFKALAPIYERGLKAVTAKDEIPDKQSIESILGGKNARRKTGKPTRGKTGRKSGRKEG